MRSPVLCTIDNSQGNGGIARVSLLLWQVMRRLLQEDCQRVTLVPPGSAGVTYLHKARFTAQIVAGQLRREFEWLLFDHVGPAATQMLVPSCYRRPYGVFLHSIEVWNEMNPIKVRTLREASVRIANSSYTAERVKAVHANLGSIEICPLALLPESLITCSDKGVDTRLLSQIGEESVLIVGRMLSTERHKGHFQLIHSWPEVLKRVPNAQLVIVGQGDDVTFLNTEVRDTRSVGRVLFTGWVSEQTLAAIYERVAVYAMPSNGEGFGLVFLEAMKHRLPCIASSSDASREIVLDGSTGFLVNQADERMLVQRIVSLLTDSNLRRGMGEAGFKRLNECFSFDRFEERLISALKPLRASAVCPSQERVVSK